MSRIAALRILCALFLLALLPGCLAERSFPMVESRIVRREPSPVSTRQWAAQMHRLAEGRLPTDKRAALLTDDLIPPEIFRLQLGEQSVADVVQIAPEVLEALAPNRNNPPRPMVPVRDIKPRDVWGYFRLNPNNLDSLFHNLTGIEHTAQVTSPTPEKRDGHLLRPAWDGFKDIDVPVGNGVQLYGRLGTPEKSREIPGSYVIITHGLFGSIDGFDMRNQMHALRRAGHHVLALEMRGHGETDCCHPEYVISFGIDESGDLLGAARWLKSAHGAKRVGLICFSLTAYESILAAWLDGKKPVTDFTGVPLLTSLPRHETEPAFNAGILAISAPIGIIDVADRFDKPVTQLEAPVKGTFQSRVARRLEGYKDPSGFSMWDLGRCEFGRSDKAKLYDSFVTARPDLLKFIDLSRDNYAVGAARMENIRVPLLVLNAANDPLGSGQSVADLFSRQKNPNIGVILLQHGGHMGFTALSPDYYYSVMLNYFDPRTAPVVVSSTVE